MNQVIFNFVPASDDVMQLKSFKRKKKKKKRKKRARRGEQSRRLGGVEGRREREREREREDGRRFLFLTQQAS